MTCIAWLEDISDPTAGEYGWVYYSPDWIENGLDCGPMYSTDIGCYDGPLNEEPGVFWGIAAWNGAMDDPDYATFEHGIFMNYFSGEYIYVSWFPSIDGVYNIQIDIDQSTGIIYFAYELYNPDTGVNDLAVMYQTMEGWFGDESFPYWQITGPCANPAIMAENGVLNVAFESEGDIICGYTTDIENGIDFSYIADSGDDETYPDIAGSGLNGVCAYYKNGNLYAATSIDGGETWNIKTDPLNDVGGTVANEYHCVNLLPNRAFWTDTRNGVEDVYSDSIFVTPNKPTISGPKNGDPNTEYDFTVTATHPENGELYYYVDWGDGTDTGWDGPVGSGAGRTYSHTYTSEANFKIRAKAKTLEGAESVWAEHPFSTPRNRGIFFDFLAKFPILRYIFGL
jgi:hypothetical protein